MCDDYEFEKEKLDLEAVTRLVERHRAEYEELKAGTLRARIAELEDDVRRKQATIEACRRQIKKDAETRKRWAQRIADGITEVER